ncbi:MAG: NADH-quinone oxidoreductase subunit N [Proteobacteria bacterium]|nr:NADH-quinone oxidoreductase subunit N [Pseudomonadota bacterium]MBU1711218.1 NADH-quinone oxidoreductase subunit N [Pseudomonadota bacterium]
MNLALFAPELFLLFGSLVLFLISLGKSNAKSARNATIFIALINVVICLSTMGQNGTLFYEAYQVDLFSQFFKVVISAGFAFVVLFGCDLKGINKDIRAEYYLFMMLSTLGLVMLVSCVELLAMFIALELSSFSLYLLVPMRDDRAGLKIQMESAIKYILFGVVATGIMLFGMSYLFGLTGSTYFVEMIPKLHQMYTMPVAIVAIAMFMGGFFFKLAVFPFHFWVPDVYQGASNETTAFIASIPKIAAVAMLIRVITLVSPSSDIIVTMLMILSVGSMFYGNLIALVQKDIKRLLGFSGIAHAGFVLIGLLTLKDSGYATAIYYIIGYLVMNMACFLVICKVSREGENVTIDDLSGLHQRAPLLALTLGVGMFALAGIPPFVGFMGKFMLLAGALKQGHLILVILAALNTAIAIYYYLSVVRVSYTTDPEDRPAVPVDGVTWAVSITLMIIIIAMGVLPSKIVDMATAAVNVITVMPGN